MKKEEKKAVRAFIARTEVNIANLENLASSFETIGQSATAELIRTEKSTIDWNMKNFLATELQI